MTQSAATIIVLLAALFAANLPFVFSRRFLFWVKFPQGKPLHWCLLEMWLGYALVGFLARALEGLLGQVHSQGWEFYVVTSALFLTLGFPGFVHRFLR